MLANESRVFLPAVAMAALTCVVWLRMLATRVAEIRRDRVRLQTVALSAQAAATFRDTRAADNFRNLFELPVLFYMALAVTALTAQGDVLVLALAWLFVLLRVVHSAIHCGYNKVLHRFYAYLTGGVVLWLLWIVLAARLLDG